MILLSVGQVIDFLMQQTLPVAILGFVIYFLWKAHREDVQRYEAKLTALGAELASLSKEFRECLAGDVVKTAALVERSNELLEEIRRTMEKLPTYLREPLNHKNAG